MVILPLRKVGIAFTDLHTRIVHSNPSGCVIPFRHILDLVCQNAVKRLAGSALLLKAIGVCIGQIIGAPTAAEILAVLYRETADGILLSLAITFGTVTHHFVMQLLIGLIFRSVMRNRADYGKQWYRADRHEMALYEN